jgi:hypothetical protein
MHHHHLHAAAEAARSAQKIPEPRLPDVIWQRHRGYMLRSELNRYEQELKAVSLGVPPVPPQPIETDPLVPLKQVASELGFGRRTLGRRILEARRKAELAQNEREGSIADEVRA